MGKYIYILFALVLMVDLQGQNEPAPIRGQVSFISSQNIYVRFKSTEGISEGDTLFSLSNGEMLPVLVVNNLSSSSCICTAISSPGLSVSDDVFAVLESEPDKPVEPVVKINALEKTDKVKQSVAEKDSADVNKPKQKIKGSISAYSYSDFSNTLSDNSQRFRYTFSLDAKNIENSRFSFETYVSFRHKMGEWGEVKDNVFNALKIYNLAAKYKLGKSTQISIGRRINPKISSIGPVDGLQLENTIGKFSLGAVVGTRPDYTNYGFDKNLLQYGAYCSLNTKNSKTYSETSLAFMQQTNNSKTDRRFVYFQHSNSLLTNLYFFSTLEIDLFKLDSISKPQNTFNPTGLYLSLRYKISKKISISGSYDARKNIMYYETYKTFIDRVLESEIRQGFRFSANYRITRDIMFGIQSGYRFLKSDPQPSKNAYSYLTYSQVPGIKVTATINATYLESSYMNGKIFGASLTKDIFSGNVQLGAGYRYVDYRLPENLISIRQDIIEMNVSCQFFWKMSLSVNYEGTIEQKNRYNRIYFQIRKRF